MNNHNIFLLTAYFNSFPTDTITPSLMYLNQESLLFKIRLKTLDIGERIKIMEYVNKTRRNLNEIIAWLENTDYYDVIKTVES